MVQLNSLQSAFYPQSAFCPGPRGSNLGLAGCGVRVKMEAGCGMTEILIAELNNVIYVCDTQTSCIKIFKTLKKITEFLKGIGELFYAFSPMKSTRRTNPVTFRCGR